jgi:hypothetical protein
MNMTNPPTTERKKPSFHVYTIVGATPEKKGYWHKIGAAFAHDDAKGITVQFDSHPIGDRVVLRLPTVVAEPVEPEVAAGDSGQA